MPTKKLTKRILDAAEVTAAEYMLWDTDVAGFGVRVHPTGRKTFVFRCRPGGGRAAVQRKITIGDYGKLTVDQARREATRYAGEVAAGRDPGADRDTKRSAQRTAREALTVAEFGEVFLADVRARRKPTTATEYARQWCKHVLPAIGPQKVAEVSSKHIASLHSSMSTTPYQANRVLAMLGAFFTFAERHEVRPRHSNPAHEQEPYIEQARERFLSPDEMARLGESLERALSTGVAPAPNRRRKPKTGPTAKHRPRSAGEPKAANPYAIAAIRFLLLSGWREKEVLRLRWSEVDAAHTSVILADTKTRRSIRRLGAAARNFLATVPRLEGSPFVFPGRSADKPLIEINRVWYAVRHAAGLDDVRLHDLRHTHASVGASRGHSLLFVGKLLGHKNASTTQKYAHLWEDPVQDAANDITADIAERLGIVTDASPQEPEPAPTLPLLRLLAG
jgi:integrase